MGEEKILTSTWPPLDHYFTHVLRIPLPRRYHLPYHQNIIVSVWSPEQGDTTGTTGRWLVRVHWVPVLDHVLLHRSMRDSCIPYAWWSRQESTHNSMRKTRIGKLVWEKKSWEGVRTTWITLTCMGEEGVGTGKKKAFTYHLQYAILYRMWPLARLGDDWWGCIGSLYLTTYSTHRFMRDSCIPYAWWSRQESMHNSMRKTRIGKLVWEKKVRRGVKTT